jgi:DNA-binding NtrC family response regulator
VRPSRAHLRECKAVRRDIPFILLTGYGTLELEKKAFQEGAYAVVLKPVDVDVLLSVVTHAIIRREVDQAGPRDPLSSLSIDALRLRWREDGSHSVFKALTNG